MRVLFWTLIAIAIFALLTRLSGKRGRVLGEVNRVVQSLATVLRFVMYGVLAFMAVKLAIYLMAPLFQ